MPPAIAHLTKHVPADIDASCLADLIADCRAMCAGALPAEPLQKVIDLTKTIPAARVPETAKGAVVVIRESVVSLIEGFADYGS